MSLSSIIRVWCQCLEVFVHVPPAGDVSPRIRWGGGSCVQLKRRVSKRAFTGGGSIHSLRRSFTILFFWRESTKDACLTQLVFLLRDPLPVESVARLPHVHPCLDWFSVCILEGITAICRLLKNKGGSSLSSLHYFRGITWSDKHALALLCTCSLFCLDLSNCLLYFKANHLSLSQHCPALWTEATLYSSVSDLTPIWLNTFQNLFFRQSYNKCYDSALGEEPMQIWMLIVPYWKSPPPAVSGCCGNRK